MLRWLTGLICLFSLPLLAVPRVISLAPHLTELAYAAGMGPQLIAASSYSDYPPQAAKLEDVASWQGINIERILALKPDLLLAWHGGSPQRSLNLLEQLGIQVLYLDAHNLDDIAANLDTLATYSAQPEQAKAAAAQLREQFDKLRKEYQWLPKRRVFLQFRSQPLFTSSGHTLQSQILTLCGGENVFAHSPVPWPQVGREQVLSRKPQLIVLPGDQREQSEVKAFWGTQLTIPIITLPEDWFNRDGPRLLLAAQNLCQQLANLDNIATEVK